MAYNYKMRSQKVLQVAERHTPVVDVQWDRLSSSYLLVAYQFFVSLWDVESAMEMQVFEKQTIDITSIAWLDWTAGNFVTSNSRNCNLKVWNASQKQPIETYSFAGDCGINSIFFCKGKRRVVCAGDDGSVSVMNVQNNQLEFRSMAGHTETIFDCKLSPKSCNTFCTASYDSTVKVWSTDLKLTSTLHGNGDVIYCCDWSPKASLIAASTVTGMIILWDVDSGRELARFSHHRKASYSVAWNQHMEKLICSTSADGTVVVFQINYETLYDPHGSHNRTGSRRRSDPDNRSATMPTDITFRFVHPAAVYGCAWSPTHAPIFATGCQDGVVRVFNHSLVAQLVYVLQGSPKRTFGVYWSPLLAGYLAAGSDDHNIHLWDMNLNAALQESFAKEPLQQTRVLSGHTGYVRGISWNHEHRNLLLSGSWDSTIRLWDAINGSCLYTIHDHIADIYAITSHPDRPFTYISCSRDTTVRMWELEGIFALMRYYAVWDGCLDRILDSNNSSPLATAMEAANIASNQRGGDNASKGAGAKDEITLAESIKEFASTHASHNLMTLAPLVQGRGSSAVNSSLALTSLKESARSYRGGGGLADSSNSERRGGYGGAEAKGDTHQPFERKIPTEAVTLANNFYKMYSFFTGSSGSMELWENALSILSTRNLSILKQAKSFSSLSSAMQLRPLEMRTIFNEADVLNLARSEARKAEAARMSHRRGSGDITAKMAEHLRTAAMDYSRVGDFSKYCSLMVEVGDWTAALAMAPSVSMEFWRSLCVRYAQQLIGNSSEQCIPYLLAAGKDGDAVDFYLRRQDPTHAMTVAKMSEARVDLIPDYLATLNHLHAEQHHGSGNGGGDAAANGSPTKGLKSVDSLSSLNLGMRTVSLGNIDADMGVSVGLARSTSMDLGMQSEAHIRERTSKEVDDSRLIVKVVAAQAAKQHLDSARPLIAAAQYLSVNDIDAAIAVLSSSFEPDLAYALALCFDKDTTPYIIDLADRCAGLNALDLALDMVSTLPHSEEEAGLLLSRYCNDSSARKMISHRGLRLLSDWLHRAEEEEQIGSDADAVTSYVIGRDFTRAVSVGMDALKRYVRDPLRLSAANKKLLRSLKYVRATELPASQRSLFLCYMLWFGAHEAAECGLLDTGCAMLAQLFGFADAVSFPLSNDEVQVHWMLFQICAGDRAAVKLLEAVIDRDSKTAPLATSDCVELLRDLRSFLTEATAAMPNQPPPTTPVSSAALRPTNNKFGDGVWGPKTFAILK